MCIDSIVSVKVEVYVWVHLFYIDSMVSMPFRRCNEAKVRYCQEPIPSC